MTFDFNKAQNSPLYATEWNALLDLIPFSYVVFKKGSLFYAIPYADGGSILSDSDAATVIQAAINASSIGQAILLKKAAYNITTGLTLPEGINIFGEGSSNTDLYSTSAIDILTLQAHNTLMNLRVNGYGSNSPTSGISITGTSCSLINVRVSGVNANPAIKVTGATLNQFFNPRILNCKIGLQLNNLSHVNIVFGGTIMSNVASSKLVDIQSAAGTKMFGTDLEGVVTETTGIYINYSNSEIQLFGVRFEDLVNGIYWNEVGRLDLISGGQMTNVTNPIVNKPTDSRIKFLQGYTTENSGLSTGTGAQQTIAHGLASTPNRVYFSNIEDGADPYQSAAADATNIYVLAGSGLDYVWKAEIF